MGSHSWIVRGQNQTQDLRINIRQPHVPDEALHVGGDGEDASLAQRRHDCVPLRLHLLHRQLAHCLLQVLLDKHWVSVSSNHFVVEELDHLGHPAQLLSLLLQGLGVAELLLPEAKLVVGRVLRAQARLLRRLNDVLQQTKAYEYNCKYTRNLIQIANI